MLPRGHSPECHARPLGGVATGPRAVEYPLVGKVGDLLIDEGFEILGRHWNERDVGHCRALRRKLLNDASWTGPHPGLRVVEGR